MRSQRRNDTPIEAHRRRRSRLLPRPQPLLLRLPAARDPRARSHAPRLGPVSPKRGERDVAAELRRGARRPPHPPCPPRRARPRTRLAAIRHRIESSSGPAKTCLASNATALAPSRPARPPVPTLPRARRRDRAQPPPRTPQPQPHALHNLTTWNQPSSPIPLATDDDRRRRARTTYCPFPLDAVVSADANETPARPLGTISESLEAR